MSEENEDEFPKVISDETKLVSDSTLTDAADEVVNAAYKKKREQAQPTGWRAARGIGRSGPSDEEISESLEWIPECFEKYLEPHPTVFDSLIEIISKVDGEFGQAATAQNLADTDRGAFFIAQNNAGKWHGTMAENFNREFLAPIPGIMQNHGRVAGILHAEMKKTKELYLMRRKNVKTVADQAVNAIEALGESGIDATLAGLITIGTVMTIGPTGFAVTGAALIGGATMGATEGDDPETVPLAANTVDGVLDNMWEALNQIDESITEQEDTLIEAMKDTEEVVQQNLFVSHGEKTKLLPLQPDLASADVESIKSSFVQFK